MIKIVRHPIDLQEVLRWVQVPEAGAVDVFIGTTRDHSDGKKVISLEYEAYEPMALKEMEKIQKEAAARWSIQKVAIVHRIGRVEIGEASVVVAVAAAHRNETFSACRFVIDMLKKNVPIWKKELFEDGEVWVGFQSDRPSDAPPSF
jgi:molybdopterin synthase catalytic subunit